MSAPTPVNASLAAPSDALRATSCGNPSSSGPRSRPAFDRLVRPHLEHLHRVAVRRLQHDDAAWDCVQDSLVALWQAPQWPHDERHVQGWLVRAVIHRALHAQRSQRRVAHYHAVAGNQLHDDCQPNNTADGIALAELEASLHETLRELEFDYAEAFRLREFEGLSYADMAKRLQVPLGTVRSRLGRARVAIRVALRQKLGTHVCPICNETLHDAVNSHESARLA